MSCPDFVFGGISSRDIGIKRVFEGDITYPLSSGRNILTAKPMERDRRIISRTAGEPLAFSYILSPIDGVFTDELINSVYKWLCRDDYSRLYPDSESDFYYLAAAFASQSDIMLFAKKRGYFEVDFVCDSPNGYIDTIKTADIPANGTTVVRFEDKGGISTNGSYLVPLFLSANFSGGGSLSITSSACGGVFSIDNVPSEVSQIDIDGESLTVFTDNSDISGYDLVKNIESLKIFSNADTDISVSLSGGTSCRLTAAAAVPRLA